MKKLLFLIPIFSFGLDNILSPTQNSLLKYDVEKNNQESSKLKNSWINPLILKYSYSKNNQLETTKKTTKNLSISINQPIFKSGAIYNSIKYANNLDVYNSLNIEKQRKSLIKSAYQMIFNIKKIDLNLAKQTLLIRNRDIDIERKKEQYLNGVLDSSFLNNALITKNSLLEAKADLETQKEDLILQFKNLSNLDYRNIKLPKFELITENRFINGNLDLKSAEQDIKVKRNLKNMTIGDNLVTISLNGSYNYLKNEYDNQSLQFQNNKINYYNIGFSISMPFSVNSLKSVESAKISYLKSKLAYKDNKTKLENSYKSAMIKIKNIDKKIDILEKSVKLYNDLVKTTNENLKAGINTTLDLEDLENTKQIQELSIKSLKIDKELELLELYYNIDK